MADKDNKRNVNEIISSALKLTGNTKELADFYQKWSEHYTDDVIAEGYCGHQVSADLFDALYQTINPNQPKANRLILDAGCGTGLLGAALKQKGFTLIDGCDLSQAMVDIAQRSDIYQALLAAVDLSAMSGYQDNQYDGIISCGVFTDGHVPPKALLELIRLTKKNGIIVISTRTTYLDSTDFLTRVEQLIHSGKIKQLHRAQAPYLSNETVDYWGFLVC